MEEIFIEDLIGGETAEESAVEEAAGERLYTQAELEAAIGEAALKAFAEAKDSSVVKTTGVPFAPAVKNALSGVEEAFYRRNPGLI